jgi:hypothetical protein
MTTLDILKNNLIDKILATQNEKLLSSLFGIFESSNKEEKIILTSEQLEILMMSENDIKKGNLFSEDDLKSMDGKWIS